jgi:hypothetical protein
MARQDPGKADIPEKDFAEKNFAEKDFDEADIAEAWRLVATPLGEPWSGRARYAAAVTLNAAGLLGDEVLEVYRMVSRLDGADPLLLIADFGLDPPRP